MSNYPVLPSWKRVQLPAGEKCEAACEWCEGRMHIILDKNDKSRYFCSEGCADRWLGEGVDFRTCNADHERLERERTEWLRAIGRN